MGTSTQTSSAPPGWLVRATGPLATRLAGRRWFPLWAVVHHRGRRSGTAYRVPVAIVPQSGDDSFLIGLPWGPSTNWARNVIAAGGATVTWKGRDHAVTNPRIITSEEAAARAKPFLRRILAGGRFPAFLLLDR